MAPEEQAKIENLRKRLVNQIGAAKLAVFRDFVRGLLDDLNAVFPPPPEPMTDAEALEWCRLHAATIEFDPCGAVFVSRGNRQEHRVTLSQAVEAIRDAEKPLPRTFAGRPPESSPPPRLLTNEEADAFCEKHDVIVSWWRLRDKHSRCCACIVRAKVKAVYAPTRLEAIVALKKKLGEEV